MLYYLELYLRADPLLDLAVASWFVAASALLLEGVGRQSKKVALAHATALICITYVLYIMPSRGMLPTPPQEALGPLMNGWAPFYVMPIYAIAGALLAPFVARDLATTLLFLSGRNPLSHPLPGIILWSSIGAAYGYLLMGGRFAPVAVIMAALNLIYLEAAVRLRERLSTEPDRLER